MGLETPDNHGDFLVKELPNRDYLHSVLSYEPDTGRLVWKARPEDKRWHRRYAGREAGMVDGFYRRVRLLGRNHRAHRLIWWMVYGAMPEVIDHIDRDGTNNRLANLRAASASLNASNVSKPAGKLLRGVRKTNRGPNYFAQHACKGRMIHLGTFPTEELAHQAYLRAIDARFGQKVLVVPANGCAT
jgi:hypothetical protein